MKKTDYKLLGCPEPETGKPRSTKEINRIKQAVKAWFALIKKKAMG